MHKKPEYRAVFAAIAVFVLAVSCKTMDMEPRNEVIKDTIEEMETKSEEEVAIEELKASIEVKNQIVYGTPRIRSCDGKHGTENNRS